MTQAETFGILGAGSIGCYIGAHLLRAGYSTQWVGRSALGVCIKEHGLRITKTGGGDFTLPPAAVPFAESVESLRDCSIVLVTVKSGATELAAKQLAALWKASPKPRIQALVSLQNGLHNAQELRSGLPDAADVAVIPGMVPYNVVWQSPSHFHCGTSGTLVIGAEPQAIASRIERAFLQAGLEAKTHPRMAGILWGKLLVNLNNPVNALSNQPLKQELLDRGYRTIVAALMQEGLDLLQKAHIQPINPFGVHPRLVPHVLRLPTFLFRRLAARMVSIDPEARSSMWQDLTTGRATEIDFINGEIVALARSLQEKAPLNEAITRLIHEREFKSLQAITAQDLWRALYSHQTMQ